MQPLISVIVPVYNGERYLEKCIESLEEQTYKNLEIILINDGSTDGTGAVCVRLKKRFENIHVITTEDAGVSAARNAGLRAAKGTFVTFVDADDRLRPKAIEILLDCMMETGSDVAGCRFYSWESASQWEGFLNKRYRVEKPVKYEPAQYLQEQILKGNTRCWSKLYRRSAIGGHAVSGKASALYKERLRGKLSGLRLFSESGRCHETEIFGTLHGPDHLLGAGKGRDHEDGSKAL